MTVGGIGSVKDSALLRDNDDSCTHITGQWPIARMLEEHDT